jgi:hypothetical protein
MADASEHGGGFGVLLIGVGRGGGFFKRTDETVGCRRIDGREARGWMHHRARSRRSSTRVGGQAGIGGAAGAALGEDATAVSGLDMPDSNDRSARIVAIATTTVYFPGTGNATRR